MDKKINVLIIDDSEYDCELTLHALKKSGYDFAWERVDSEGKMISALESKQWDVMLSDHSMPNFSSMEALRIKREFKLDIPFIIVSGKIGEEQVVEAMRNGCQDYVSKDKLVRLGSVIDRELMDVRIRQEKKQMELKLENEQKNLNTIFNAAPIGMIILNEKAEIIKVNTTILNMLKNRSEEVLNKAIGNAFKCLNSFVDKRGCGYSNECSLCILKKTLLEVFNSGIAKNGVEINHQLLIDGNVKNIWFNINSVPISINNNKHVVIVMDDITERKTSEEELRRYQTLSNKANDLILFFDMDGNIIEANEAAIREYGYSKEEILTKTILDLRHQKNSDFIKKQLEKAAVEGIIYDTVHYKKNGDYFQAEVSSSGTLIQGKKVILSVVRNITERKTAEIEMKKAKAAAEEANRAKSEFLANMSHEIRTPLNGIIGMTDLTLLTELDKEQKENLNIVKSCGVTLLNVINDILDFSKIEAGKVVLEKIVFNIKQLMDDVIKPHKAKAQEKSVDLFCEINKDVLPLVVGDPNKLGQILNNLIGNAVKFTDIGSVSIYIEKVKDNSEYIELKFTISDTGIGISGDDGDKLFRNFSQVDSSITRKYGGTGLGLTISKKLVELMDGQVWFESEEGIGSRFYFTVRLGISSDSYIDNDKIQKIKHIENYNKELDILVVEDDRTNQMVISSMLKAKGYNIDIACDGSEALDMIPKNKYDAILMDIQMPVMDGIEATKRIRLMEGQTNVHIPIIALTAHAIQGDREKFLSAGMDYYISKPVHMDELYNIIEKAANEKERSQFDDKNIFERYNITSMNEIAISVFEETVEKIGIYIEKIKPFLISGSFTNIEQIAHKIKRLAVEINANEVKNIAFKIELSARKEEDFSVMNQYEKLIQEYKELI